jgi:hypothetical protein
MPKLTMTRLTYPVSAWMWATMRSKSSLDVMSPHRGMILCVVKYVVAALVSN